MKKKMLMFFLMIMIPFSCFAISDNYKDIVHDITDTKVDNNKINLYLFHGKECPHCEEERIWLKKIEKEYKEYLNIYMFEVWHDDENASMMNDVKEKLEISKSGVPLTVVGEEYFVGYSDTIGSRIESAIKEYAELDTNTNNVKIPILGNVNMKSVSIPLVAVILGFIDGFNPCAMWILLFLINMLFNLKNKKKAWVLGLTFLLISGLVYFLSMLGLNLVLGVATINWIKKIIAIFILCAGILNLRKYLINRKKDEGCTVVDDKKRKKIITRMKKIMNSKSFIISIIGISILAISVNLIELACSLGFPLIFTEILDINNIKGFSKVIYLLLYILFYMIDDIAVFSISMKTLEATGITNKYNKLCTLISSIIMIIIGMLLIIKPDWLMFNF